VRVNPCSPLQQQQQQQQQHFCSQPGARWRIPVQCHIRMPPCKVVLQDGIGSVRTWWLHLSGGSCALQQCWWWWVGGLPLSGLTLHPALLLWLDRM
jgi:hypothetical protein